MTEAELVPDEVTDITVATSADIVLADEQDMQGLELPLPTYADVTDDKIMLEVRRVFGGFTYDDTTDYSKEFKDPEEVADYADDCLGQIKDVQTQGTAVKLTKSSAALAYFWFLGAKINNVLEHAKYGNGAVNKIAARMKKSVPFVYQIRAVATNLTRQDAYLLGMRECCSTTTLRKLAQIRDADRRRQIIDVFINETQDMADATRMERAVKAFRMAINEALKHVDTIEQDTTNPEAVVDSDAELVNASYAAAMEAIRLLNGATKKLAAEETVFKVCDAMGDLAITETVPNADDWLARIKEEITAAKNQALTAKSNIDDMLVELDSALQIEVLRNETTDGELDI